MGKGTKQIVAISVLTLFLLFVLAYFARGWVRNIVLPAHYERKHSASIAASLESAYDTSSGPLNTTIKKQTDPKCKLAAAEGVNTQIDCWGSIAFIGKEPVSSTETISNQLVLLQEALQDDGWAETADLADWKISTAPKTEGSQGYPDIRKSYDDTTCTLFLRYDKKFYGTIQCVRNAYFLGNPNILFSS